MMHLREVSNYSIHSVIGVFWDGNVGFIFADFQLTFVAEMEKINTETLAEKATVECRNQNPRLNE